MYKRGRCNREIVIIETAKISIAKVRREKRQRFVCPSGGGKERERGRQIDIGVPTYVQKAFKGHIWELPVRRRLLHYTQSELSSV